MTDSLPMPLDVRLMNVTTALLATGLVLAGLALNLLWPRLRRSLARALGRMQERAGHP